MKEPLENENENTIVNEYSRITKTTLTTENGKWN